MYFWVSANVYSGQDGAMLEAWGKEQVVPSLRTLYLEGIMTIHEAVSTGMVPGNI